MINLCNIRTAPGLKLVISCLLIALSASCAPQQRSPEPVDSLKYSQSGIISDDPLDIPPSETETLSVMSPETEVSDSKLPEDWPDFIPIMSGLNLTETEVSIEGNMMGVFESVDTLTSLKQWHESALLETGWEPQPVLRQVDTDTEFRLLFAREGDGLHVIGIVAEGYTKITLMYYPESGD